MKISIIIAVYKNYNALRLIFDALRQQTYKNFEVVVAEDDQNETIKKVIEQYKHILEIKHISHPDDGLQKNIIQNKAIAAASGEYLIFIDGDCIPYSNFVENNMLLAQNKTVLTGRRVNLPKSYSEKLINNQLSSLELEKYYLYYGIKNLIWEKNVKFEQGIVTKPNSFLYNTFIKNRKRNIEILGCNFSCFKKDMLTINGFDESYGYAILGDDTDLTWRFQAAGCQLISSKNICNVFHLYHPPRSSSAVHDISYLIERFEYRKANALYIVEDSYGISKYVN